MFQSEIHELIKSNEACLSTGHGTETTRHGGVTNQTKKKWFRSIKLLQSLRAIDELSESTATIKSLNKYKNILYNDNLHFNIDLHIIEREIKEKINLHVT